MNSHHRKLSKGICILLPLGLGKVLTWSQSRPQDEEIGNVPQPPGHPPFQEH